MRAYAIDRRGTIADVTLHDLPKPSPKPNELLVRVRGAAVNPADLKVIYWIGAASFLHAKVYPITLGYDFSGEVAETSGSVTGRKLGDEVYGFIPYAGKTRGGTFAEYVAVDASTVGVKPKSVAHGDAAAAATSMATALQAIRKSKIELGPGKSVLINGASGGVGSCAVQIAKILGARVVGTSSAAKVEFVKGLGADHVYDYKTTPLQQIDEKFEMVLDAAANSSFGTCSKLLKPSGTYIALLPSPGLFLGMAMAAFTSKRCGFVVVQPVAKDFDQIAGWFDEGKLKTMVDATYPLAEVGKALERLKAGDIKGKLAISID